MPAACAVRRHVIFFDVFNLILSSDVLASRCCLLVAGSLPLRPHSLSVGLAADCSRSLELRLRFEVRANLLRILR